MDPRYDIPVVSFTVSLESKNTVVFIDGSITTTILKTKDFPTYLECERYGMEWVGSDFDSKRFSISANYKRA